MPNKIYPTQVHFSIALTVHVKQSYIQKKIKSYNV